MCYFCGSAKIQFQELEEYKDIPDLYEPAYQSMKNEVTIYFDSVKELLEGFIDNLKTKVSEISNNP